MWILTDMTVTQPTSTVFNVQVGMNPRFRFNNVTYFISSDIGCSLLSDEASFALLVSLSRRGNFVDDSTNSGPGGAQGWNSNPNDGFGIGSSFTFSVPHELNFASIDRYSLHMTLSNQHRPGAASRAGNATRSFAIPTLGAPAMFAMSGLAPFLRRAK